MARVWRTSVQDQIWHIVPRNFFKEYSKIYRIAKETKTRNAWINQHSLSLHCIAAFISSFENFHLLRFQTYSSLSGLASLYVAVQVLPQLWGYSEETPGKKFILSWPRESITAGKSKLPSHFFLGEIDPTVIRIPTHHEWDELIVASIQIILQGIPGGYYIYDIMKKSLKVINKLSSLDLTFTMSFIVRGLFYALAEWSAFITIEELVLNYEQNEATISLCLPGYGLVDIYKLSEQNHCYTRPEDSNLNSYFQSFID